MTGTIPTTQFRLVALDIDGTILNSSYQVTPELKEVLAELARRGVRTVLCTGRRWGSTAPVLAQIEHAHPVVVCAGGALVRQAEPESTLHAAPIEHATARRAVDLFRRGGLVPILLYDRPLAGRDLWVARADGARAEGLGYVRAYPAAFEYYEGDYPDIDERPLEVFTVDEVERVRAAEAGVRAGLEGRSIVSAMFQPRYGNQLALEVHAPEATKWSALQWLIGRWGIAAEDVVALGDDVNDIPMLRAAGLSFAMGNGSEEVKAAADAVTLSNDEHGAAAALREVFHLD